MEISGNNDFKVLSPNVNKNKVIGPAIDQPMSHLNQSENILLVCGRTLAKIANGASTAKIWIIKTRVMKNIA